MMYSLVGIKFRLRHEKTRKSQNNPFLAGGLIILHSTVLAMLIDLSKIQILENDLYDHVRVSRCYECIENTVDVCSVRSWVTG